MPENAKVFLSYSRADREFVQRLAEFLNDRGYAAVFDQGQQSPDDPDTILTAQDEWWLQLKRMIALADSVVFVVSPESAGSRVCDDEIAFARSLGKRVVAILRRTIDFSTAPERLRTLNVKLDFRDDSSISFDDAVTALAHELGNDIEWHRAGAHFARLAQKWDADGRPDGLLLRMGAIAEADRWAANRPATASPVGEVVKAYLAGR